MIQVTLSCSSAEHANAVLEAYAGWKSGIKFETPAEPAAKPKAPPAEPAAKPKAVAAEPAEVSLEDVRAKLADLSQAGKKTEVKQLLAKFGASKLTELNSSTYGEVLAAAEQL